MKIFRLMAIRTKTAPFISLFLCLGIVITAGLVFVGLAPWGYRNVWIGRFYGNVDFLGEGRDIFLKDLSFINRMKPESWIQDENFSAVFFTCLNVDRKKKFEFELGSDDGSRLFVDEKLTINNWGYHGLESKSATIEIDGGNHRLTIFYFQAHAEASLRFRFKEDDGSKVAFSKLLSMPTLDSRNIPRCGGSFSSVNTD